GLLILGIIASMMIADITYDSASLALSHRAGSLGCDAALGDASDLCSRVQLLLAHFGHQDELPAQFALWPAPAGSLAAVLLGGLSAKTLVFLAQAGFWCHSTLVLIFLNLLPHSKHFHIITSLPNAFTTDLTPRGRLKPMAESSDKLMEVVGAASEK